jgi:hypothetical protein
VLWRQSLPTHAPSVIARLAYDSIFRTAGERRTVERFFAHTGTLIEGDLPAAGCLVPMVIETLEFDLTY